MVIKTLGKSDYASVWSQMKAFTERRTDATEDQIWVTEHPPVFTLGLAGDPAHLLHAGDIPLVHCDRGGQITYHGPGQLVVYPLLDLRRNGLKVREYVHVLEQTIIQTLARCGIDGALRRPGAPGVYLLLEGQWAKIAALGIKVKNGCTYHGLSLNVAMDLTPFDAINPCGYAGLRTIDMQVAGVKMSTSDVYPILLEELHTELVRARSAAQAPTAQQGVGYVPKAPPPETPHAHTPHPPFRPRQQ